MLISYHYACWVAGWWTSLIGSKEATQEGSICTEKCAASETPMQPAKQMLSLLIGFNHPSLILKIISEPAHFNYFLSSYSVSRLEPPSFQLPASRYHFSVNSQPTFSYQLPGISYQLLGISFWMPASIHQPAWNHQALSICFQPPQSQLPARSLQTPSSHRCVISFQSLASSY